MECITRRKVCSCWFHFILEMKWTLKGETVWLRGSRRFKKHASGGISSARYFIVLHLLFSYERATMKHSCIELHAREKKLYCLKRSHKLDQKKTNRPF